MPNPYSGNVHNLGGDESQQTRVILSSGGYGEAAQAAPYAPPAPETKVDNYGTSDIIDIQPTTGADKYVVRTQIPGAEKGLYTQKTMSKAEILAIGGKIPETIEERSQIGQEVQHGATPEQAYEKVVGTAEAAKRGMTLEEYQKALLNHSIKVKPGDYIQAFADKYGLTLTVAAETLQRYYDDPYAAEFQSLNKWEKQDLNLGLQGVMQYTANYAWDTINNATKKNPKILTTTWKDGDQRNVLNLEEAAKSGIADPDIFNLIGRSNVPTVVKQNASDPGTYYPHGFGGITRQQINEIQTQAKERDQAEGILTAKGLNKYSTYEQMVEAGLTPGEFKKLGYDVTVGDIKNTEDFNEYINSKDTPEEFKKAYKEGGFEAYQKAYDAYSVAFHRDNVVDDSGKYMPLADFIKLDEKYRDIAKAKGFDVMESAINEDEIKQTKALNSLKFAENKDSTYDFDKLASYARTHKDADQTFKDAGFVDSAKLNEDIKNYNNAPLGVDEFSKRYFEDKGIKQMSRSEYYQKLADIEGVGHKEAMQFERTRKEAVATYRDKFGLGAEVGTVAGTVFSQTVFIPARALRPDVEIKDISGLEWAVGTAQVGLFAVPAVGGVVSKLAGATAGQIVSKGLQVGAGSVFSYATAKDIVATVKAGQPISTEQKIAIVMDTLILASAVPGRAYKGIGSKARGIAADETGKAITVNKAVEVIKSQDIKLTPTQEDQLSTALDRMIQGVKTNDATVVKSAATKISKIAEELPGRSGYALNKVVRTINNSPEMYLDYTKILKDNPEMKPPSFETNNKLIDRIINESNLKITEPENLTPTELKVRQKSLMAESFGNPKLEAKYTAAIKKVQDNPSVIKTEGEFSQTRYKAANPNEVLSKNGVPVEETATEVYFRSLAERGKIPREPSSGMSETYTEGKPYWTSREAAVSRINTITGRVQEYGFKSAVDTFGMEQVKAVYPKLTRATIAAETKLFNLKAKQLEPMRQRVLVSTSKYIYEDLLKGTRGSERSWKNLMSKGMLGQPKIDEEVLIAWNKTLSNPPSEQVLRLAKSKPEIEVAEGGEWKIIPTDKTAKLNKPVYIDDIKAKIQLMQVLSGRSWVAGEGAELESEKTTGKIKVIRKEVGGVYQFQPEIELPKIRNEYPDREVKSNIQNHIVKDKEGNEYYQGIQNRIIPLNGKDIDVQSKNLSNAIQKVADKKGMTEAAKEYGEGLTMAVYPYAFEYIIAENQDYQPGTGKVEYKAPDLSPNRPTGGVSTLTAPSKTLVSAPELQETETIETIQSTRISEGESQPIKTKQPLIIPGSPMQPSPVRQPQVSPMKQPSKSPSLNPARQPAKSPVAVPQPIPTPTPAIAPQPTPKPIPEPLPEPNTEPVSVQVPTIIPNTKPNEDINKIKKIIKHLKANASDREKREYIAKLPNAYTINMGELHGLRVWWTYVPGIEEPIVVIGEQPKGAKIVKEGKGSGYETAQTTSGKLPFAEKRRIGFIKASFSPDTSPGNIDVDFTSEPIAIGRGKRSPFPLQKSKRLRLPR